jgi:hypothetical protein
MPTLGMHPWRFVSVPLSVDFSVDVVGEPQWSRPERARLVEDPCDGPPTVITRGGALARRRIPIRMYVPAGATRVAELAAIRTAIQARGPYTLTTHLETTTIVFDPSAGAVQEIDESNAISILIGLAEVGSTTPAATLTSSVSTIGPVPNTIPVAWTNWTNPTAYDFVGLYLTTDPETTDIADAREVVMTGGEAFGADSLTNVGDDPGDYELRGVYGPVPTLIIGPAITITA